MSVCEMMPPKPKKVAYNDPAVSRIKKSLLPFSIPIYRIQIITTNPWPASWDSLISNYLYCERLSLKHRN